MTYNPGNPPFKSWIRENLGILHRDKELKSIFPKLDVVMRQTANIKRRNMRNRFENKSDKVTKFHNYRCTNVIYSEQ